MRSYWETMRNFSNISLGTGAREGLIYAVDNWNVQLLISLGGIQRFR